MNFFNEKVSYDKVLWKELFIGVIEGFLWCSILFLLVYGYNEELIEMLQFMSENVDKVWSLYFAILPIFIIIAFIIKLGFFVLKIDIPQEKKSRTSVVKTAKKPAKKKTTSSKKSSQ